MTNVELKITIDGKTSKVKLSPKILSKYITPIAEEDDIDDIDVLKDVLLFLGEYIHRKEFWSDYDYFR